MSNVTKFVRAELPISDTLSIDCYMMPSGEKRIGITGAALAVGRSKEYLSRLQERGSKGLKQLQGMGFQGCQIEGLVIRPDGRGSSAAKTISVQDFTKYVTWEAVVNQRLPAIIIMAAIFETGVDRILELLFQGRSVEFLLEKIEHYSTWTNEDLQQVLLYNREELANLRLGI